MSLSRASLDAIARVFNALDYRSLGEIYCDEGGEAFWEERRGPAQELGVQFANVLMERLPHKGRSLYVGAGVAEIPVLLMEALDLQREVHAFNLRGHEAAILNSALQGLPVVLRTEDARVAQGPFDHLWIVSVLNDPECFPELGALSSGRANPVTFDPQAFSRERQAVLALAASCFEKLRRPSLVTTSVDEIVWVRDWCEQNGLSYIVEDEDYPTAIVQDPICFIRLGDVAEARDSRPD
jgi:hypothetical protein